MEKPLKDIYEALQKLLGLHRQLLDTVRMEREALVNADLKGIEDATRAKQALIEAIRIAESERLKRLGSLALAWKKPVTQLSLLNIAIAIQVAEPKGAEQLRSVHGALQLLIQRIGEQNLENQALIERSLVHIHEMKRNVLGESVPAANTYSARGEPRNSTGGARLISKEA